MATFHPVGRFGPFDICPLEHLSSVRTAEAAAVMQRVCVLKHSLMLRTVHTQPGIIQPKR